MARCTRRIGVGGSRRDRRASWRDHRLPVLRPGHRALSTGLSLVRTGMPAITLAVPRRDRGPAASLRVRLLGTVAAGRQGDPPSSVAARADVRTARAFLAVSLPAGKLGDRILDRFRARMEEDGLLSRPPAKPPLELPASAALTVHTLALLATGPVAWLNGWLMSAPCTHLLRWVAASCASRRWCCSGSRPTCFRLGSCSPSICGSAAALRAKHWSSRPARTGLFWNCQCWSCWS